jgi:hypothetical protein
MKECPNINSCKLVNVNGFTGDESVRMKYMETYCRAGEQNWNTCSRYRVKKELNLCPDFVLPDSNMTLDEVMDRMEEES